MEPTKPFYASKTCWVNGITFALLALAQPEVGGLVPPRAIPYVAALNVILNLALRLLADQSTPLSLTGAPKPG